MADMIVNLYKIPPFDDSELRSRGIFIKRALPCDKTAVCEFITNEFGDGWACEAEKAIMMQPASTCYIAVKDGEVLGFACYDATAPDYYGPLGVSEKARGTGIGKALSLCCLNAMKWHGYGYAIFNAGPVDYYKKSLGAIVISQSDYDAVYENLICAEEGRREEAQEKGL